MFWIVIGIAAGSAVALGRLPILRVPLDSAVASLLSASDTLAEWVATEWLGSAAESNPELVDAARVAFAAMGPGVAAAAMILAAQASLAVRRGVGGLLVAAAFGSFFLLPWQDAVAAFAFLMAAAFLAWLALGPVAVTGLSTIAGLIGTRQIMLLTGMDEQGVPDTIHALNSDHQALAVLFAALPLVVAAAAFLGFMRDSHHPAAYYDDREPRPVDGPYE